MTCSRGCAKLPAVGTNGSHLEVASSEWSIVSTECGEIRSAVDNQMGAETMDSERDTDAAGLPANQGPWSRKLVQQIAMDIGKEAVMHVETMYPKAIEATPASFKVLCAT